MQPSLELSAEGRQLTASLEAAAAQAPAHQELIHISGVGGNLYFAYEQLRNAAEYGERHLLIRRAIERFLRRNLNFRGLVYSELGIELVSELTQSRYLKNDTIPRTAVAQINTIAHRYAKLAGAVREAYAVPAEQLANWVYQAASVEMERQVVPHASTDVYIDFLYHHYLEHIDPESFGEVDPVAYDLALYCAVHRTLLKSDIATIRYYALTARLGASGHSSLEYFMWLNERIDALYQAPLTNRIGRLVNRYGAPLRILREVLLADDQSEKVLADRAALMTRVVSECQRQYKLTRKRLNEGIIRSVLFIFITKVIIGVAIEVPYDLVVAGAISWLPLVINLLFPPAYMATIGLGVRLPGKRNTEVIQSYLTRILYHTDDPPLHYRIRKRTTAPSLVAVFNFIYTVAFLVSISLLIYVLHAIGYNPVNGTIFFIFLSAVSFLGFRLSQGARELEIMDRRRSLFSVLLDFFYIPFIRVGHWLSDKYSRLNVVAFFLDLAIEMPLKTTLRFIQQWAGFLRDKQEEL